MPGRRSTILYCPAPSVVTDRVFSIRTSLATSTVTPGRTAPDASLTTPAIVLCARAAVDPARHASTTSTGTLFGIMQKPPSLSFDPPSDCARAERRKRCAGIDEIPWRLAPTRDVGNQNLHGRLEKCRRSEVLDSVV